MAYQNAEHLLYGYSFLEFIVKEYTKDRETLRKKSMEFPRLKDTYEKNWIARGIISDLSEDFSSLINTYSLTVQNVYGYSNSVLTTVIHEPRKRFIKTVKKVVFSLDRKVDDSYLPLVEKIRQESELNRQYSIAQWVQGSLKLNSAFDNMKLYCNYIRGGVNTSSLAS